MKKTNMEKDERLLNLLRETKANSLDVYYVIYDEFLRTDENVGHLLRLVCEFPEYIGDDLGVAKSVSATVEQETKQKYLEYLEQVIIILIKENDSKEEFYEKLWDMLFNGPTAPATSEQCAVLLKMLCEDNKYIPYFQTKDVLSMDIDEFRERFSALAPKILEAVHMFKRDFSQRTEETSQIYRLMKDLSKEDASVFLAVCFNLLEENAYSAGKAEARNTEKDKE